MGFNFQCAAKISVTVVLFTLCFYYFTLPSLEEYEANQIIVTTSEETEGEILAPAVTVCAQDPCLKLEDYNEAFQTYCANETDIKKCIDSATFNFSSTILNAAKGFEPYNSSLMNPSEWIPEITLPAAGKCYTLSSSQTMEQNFMTGTIRLELRKDLNYFIYIHDVNYYVQNQNPIGIPTNFRALSPGEGWKRTFKMRTVKRKNINNCNPNPSYKFTACVRSRLSKTAGCRLPWDRWTDQSVVFARQSADYVGTDQPVAVCTTMEQFR